MENEHKDRMQGITSEEKPKKRKPGSPGMYQRIDMPTPEAMAQEDFMNNCAVRTILSGVMGSALGVVFGIFMGTMDTSVCYHCHLVNASFALPLPLVSNRRVLQ